MKWTKNQLRAINEEGRNLIVSAGAGSGKTAVLTERVLRKLNEGISIKNLLILTFTNAAAAEMKKRIRAKIETKKELVEELNLIESAYICTFDSFALSLVRKYHYLLNVKKNISIIDENIIYLEMSKEIDNIFEELYIEKDPDFVDLMSSFCRKDDDIIKRAIIDIYQKLNLRLDKENLININLYYNNQSIDEHIEKYLLLLKTKYYELYEVYENIASELEEDISYLESYFNSENYKEYKENVNFLSIPRLPNGSSDELKSQKKVFTEKVDEIKALVRFENIEEIKNTILKTKGYAKVIFNIIEKLDIYLHKFKEKNDNYTFLDVAKMAYFLVRNNDDIRYELKHQFNEIMIDEYQDTSDIQEEFIKLIANENVYMVGDIKQSIYRFRNANPDIFKNKYVKYKKSIGGGKIDLSENFRSRKEVIENINYIFDILMKDDLGGVDYKEEGRMIFGNKNYEENKPNQDYNLEIYNYINLLDKSYTKAEIEALIIARDIKEKVDSFLVYDKGKYRKARFSDFTILADRGRDFPLFKKIFEYYQIPLTIIEDEVLTNEYDIIVLSNIMRLVIKIKHGELDQEFKYLFTSIARSFLFNIKDEIILKYFVNKDFNNSDIYKKCFELSIILDELSNREFLEKIICKFNIYEKAITIGSIEGVMVRCEYLMNLADMLSSNGYHVVDFTNFIYELIENNLPIKYSLDKSTSEGVKIMNIHKSKGLEFSICYYAGLSARFNYEDLKKKFIYDNQYGIILPYFDNGIGETIIKDLYKETQIMEDLSERLRLFYVALTRCKEKMIIVCDLDDKEKRKINCLKDFLSQIPTHKFSKLLDPKDYSLTKDYQKIKEVNFNDFINITSPINVNELKLDYKVKSRKSYSKKTYKVLTKEEKENIDFGLELHYILELLDLKNPNLDELNLGPKLHGKIESFLNSKLLENIRDAKIYKEHEFIYNDSHGVIDLILEYDDYIVVIDYKTKNIDDEAYFTQVQGYKKYLEMKTGKKVYGYLYSLIDEKHQVV